MKLGKIGDRHTDDTHPGRIIVPNGIYFVRDITFTDGRAKSHSSVSQFFFEC